jgi:hypothetical protein
MNLTPAKYNSRNLYYSVFGVMAILHEATLFLLQVWRHFALKTVDHTPTGVIL